MRPVQYFSDEQLAHGRTLKPEQILQFLEDFRELHAARAGGESRGSTTISLRVPDALLRAFRARAAALGVPYQTQIKRVMEDWVNPQMPVPEYRVKAVNVGPRRTDLDNTWEVIAEIEGDNHK